MELLDDGEELWRTSWLAKDLPEAVLADHIIGLGQIDKGCIQAHILFSALFHTNLLNVSTTNCEDDAKVPLTRLTDIQNLPDFPPLDVGPLELVISDYSSEHIDKRIFKENTMAYVAGYLLQKTFGMHKCENCLVLADESGNLEKKSFYCLKHMIQIQVCSGLIVPSSEIMKLANKIEDRPISYMNDVKQTTGVGKEFLGILDQVPLNIQCGDSDKVFLLKLFIRMRIHYSLKCVNRELALTKRKTRKYIKITYFNVRDKRAK